MSNYLSGFSSRVANLRQNLLATESDGPSVQETNIARAMRSYYTEQGRTFKPKAMKMRMRIGANGNQTVAVDRHGRPEWELDDEKNVRLAIYTETEPPQQVQVAYVPTTSEGTIRAYPPINTRPVPGRAVSNQETAAVDKRDKKDRLRDRTANKRPTLSSDSLQGRGAVSNGGSYQESRAATNTYDRSNSYDSRSNRGAEKPYVAASEPWSNQPNEFEGGYNPPAPVNNYAPVKNVGARRPGGLPSGPGGNRPMGLPTGPRGKRF